MMEGTSSKLRLTRPSFTELLRQAPRRYDEPTDEEFAGFARRWTDVTGQHVTDNMHLSLRCIWRVHGGDSPRILAERFRVKGTITNLMAEMLLPEAVSPARPVADVSASPRGSKARSTNSVSNAWTTEDMADVDREESRRQGSDAR